MGPVGLLCLKETILNGRRDGFYTGIGATVSDLVYAILSYFGVGLVLNFIDEHSVGLRLFGSILLGGFSYYLYRSVPKELHNEETEQLSKMHGTKKVSVAFLVTLSNPFIILLLLSLYTRFDFVPTSEALGHGIFLLGMAAIALGALTWWYLLTYIVGQLRHRMRWRYVRIFNRLIALIIAAIALIGFISALIDIFSGSAL